MVRIICFFCFNDDGNDDDENTNSFFVVMLHKENKVNLTSTEMSCNFSG
jgi:hypothetical protein